MAKMLLFFILMFGLIPPLFAAQAQVKTLLIASHPYPERSTFIKGLEEAARSVKGVEVRNLESLYGYDTRAINGAKEREITRQYDRIVFLFPTHMTYLEPLVFEAVSHSKLESYQKALIERLGK